MWRVRLQQALNNKEGKVASEKITDEKYIAALFVMVH